MLRRGGALSLAIPLFAVLAACSSPSDSGGDGSDDAGGGTVAVVDGVVLLTAEDLAFDASVIQAPAGAAFTISFTNNDSAPHNVSVYTEEGGDQIADQRSRQRGRDARGRGAGPGCGRVLLRL